MTVPISCHRCGTPAQAGARFCGTCGGEMAAVPPSSTPAWLSQAPPAPSAFVQPAVPPQPGPATGSWNVPPQPTGGWAAPSGPAPGPDLRAWAAQYGLTSARFTAGDWAGAALAVVAGVGVMFVLAVVGLLVLGITDVPLFTTSRFVAVAAMIVALAFGGSVSVGGVSGLGVDGAAGLSVVPLTLTAIGFGLLARIFVRRLRARGVRSLGDAVLQGVRVWIVLLGALLVVCLFGRFQIGSDLTGSSGSGLGAAGLHVTAGIGGTLFFGSCWLAFVLALATVWRLPALLPPRLRAWRDRAGGPAAGAAVAVAVSCVVIVVMAVAYALVQTSGQLGTVTAGTRAGASIGALLLLLGPNVVQIVFGMAVGSPLSAASIISALYSASSGRTGISGASVSLLDITDQQPVFWLVSLAAAVAIISGGLIAAVHSASPEEARRSFWRVGVALGALLLVIAVSTSMSVTGGILGLQGGASVHLDYLLAPLFGVVWGAFGGWLGALLAPGVPPGVIAGIRGHVDRARWRAYSGGVARQQHFGAAGPMAGPGDPA